MSTPEILAETTTADGLSLRLKVPPDCLHFEGHFGEHAILPGVSQVHWVMQLAQSRLPISGRFAGLTKLKFMRVIRPGAELSLELRWQRSALSFCYRDAGGDFSQGAIRFAP